MSQMLALKAKTAQERNLRTFHRIETFYGVESLAPEARSHGISSHAK